MIGASRDPKWVVCDSDALLDLSIALGTDLDTLLARFGSAFYTLFVLVEEVSDEISRRCICDGGAWPSLRTAVERNLKNRLLLGSPFRGSSTDPAVVEYRKLGRRLNAHVGAGEAYAHSLAIHLHGTVLSRDSTAENLLRSENLPHAARIEPIDVMVFAASEDWIPTVRILKGLKRLKRDGRLQRGSGILKNDPSRALRDFDAWIGAADRIGSRDHIKLTLVRSPQRTLSG